MEFSEIWEGEKKEAVWEASEKVRKTKQNKKKKAWNCDAWFVVNFCPYVICMYITQIVEEMS